MVLVRLFLVTEKSTAGLRPRPRHRGDGIERELLARVAERAHRDAGEHRRVGLLPDDAHQPFVGSGLAAPSERVAKRAAHRVGDVAAACAPRGERMRREFDEQLRIVLSEPEDAVDPGDALNVEPDLMRDGAQHLVVGATGEEHHRGREAVGGRDLRGARILRLGRQLGLGLVLDLAVEIVDALVEGAVIDLPEPHEYVRDVLAARGEHEADVLHVLDRLLERNRDALFHVFGGGARQDRRDVDPVEVNLGILLARHEQVPGEADQDHHRERDVREGMIEDQSLVETHAWIVGGTRG
jgi:hypothetical protein